MKNQYRQDLLKFIKEKAFYKEKITLSSGKQSTCYVDIRRISLHSKGSFLIANLLWDMMSKEDFAAVGGPTLGADPILASLAYHAHLKNKSLRTFIVRKEPKKHGRTRLIEGPPLEEGEEVIILDDVATSGKSLVTAIDKLKSMKIKVKQAYTIIDREEGAAEALEKYDCPLYSIFKLHEFTK